MSNKRRFILVLFSLVVCFAALYCVTRALTIEREYRACIQDDDSSRLVSMPEAKGDLVIVNRYEENSLGVTVSIQTTTDEAEMWLVENAPKFGYFEKLEMGKGRYTLSIQPEVYDVDWVLAWLEQMGE